MSSLSPELARELDRLRERGFQVIGPGPVTAGETPPAGPVAHPMPGMHVQIRAGHRFIEGLGGTADEAVRDALGKLEPYDPT
jgi:hypothetical protein